MLGIVVDGDDDGGGGVDDVDVVAVAGVGALQQMLEDRRNSQQEGATPGKPEQRKPSASAFAELTPG